MIALAQCTMVLSSVASWSLTPHFAAWTLLANYSDAPTEPCVIASLVHCVSVPSVHIQSTNSYIIATLISVNLIRTASQAPHNHWLWETEALLRFAGFVALQCFSGWENDYTILLKAVYGGALCFQRGCVQKVFFSIIYWRNITLQMFFASGPSFTAMLIIIVLTFCH